MGLFLLILKNADIKPTFKKEDRLLKANYRPVSILATLSKVYEKLIYPQICEYFTVIFSNYLGGFRKGYMYSTLLNIYARKTKGGIR